jgi:hypothetical protein
VLFGDLLVGAALGTALLRWLTWRESVDRRRVLVLAIVLVLSVLATAGTPLGFKIFQFALVTARRSRALRIIEWFAPIPPDPLAIMFWTLALSFLVPLWRRRRRLLAGSWADWVLVASALALLPLAASSYRNIGPFLLVTVPALSRVLGTDFRFRLPRRKLTGSPPPHVEHPRANVTIVGVAALAALATIGSFWVTVPQSFGWRPVSDGALAAVRACPGPLYNHYNEGGYLMWFLPDRPVYADSRQDLYDFDFLAQHFEIEHRQRPYKPSFERWGIRCAFLSVKSPTVETLQGDGWQTRFRDDKWAVLAAP